MSETKLEKVTDVLYHEAREGGKPLKWQKGLRFVSITLNEIRTELVLEIERPETAIKLLPGSGADLSEEDKYTQYFRWRIAGTGYLDGDRIGVIKSDGSISSRQESLRNSEISIQAVDDSDREKACGSIWYSDATFETRHREPYISMRLLVPRTEFERVCEEVTSGRLRVLELGVHLDLFESEVDSFFREPGMTAGYYIEDGTYSNRAFMSWLRAASRTSVKKDIPESPEDLFQAEGFHEQKINYFGQWLINFGQSFSAVAGFVSKAVLYFAFGYLLLKGLAWFLHWPL